MEGRIPYPASSTPRWRFIPSLEIDFGRERVVLKLFFYFANVLGRGGTPFSSNYGGSLGVTKDLSDDVSSPLLQIGQVKYY